MEDQVKCVKCHEAKEREKEAKLDKLLGYMQDEIDLKKRTIEQAHDIEIHRLQINELGHKTVEYYLYAAIGIGIITFVYQQEFKEFLKSLKVEN